MFEILPLTPKLLAELGDELGGCDFTDPSQIDFLVRRPPLGPTFERRVLQQ